MQPKYKPFRPAYALAVKKALSEGAKHEAIVQMMLERHGISPKSTAFVLKNFFPAQSINRLSGPRLAERLEKLLWRYRRAVDKAKQKQSKKTRRIILITNILAEQQSALRNVGDAELFFSVFREILRGRSPEAITFSFRKQGYDLFKVDVAAVAHKATVILEAYGKRATTKGKFNTVKDLLGKTGFLGRYADVYRPLLKAGASAMPGYAEDLVGKLVSRRLKRLGKKI